jgi:Immunity protein 50
MKNWTDFLLDSSPIRAIYGDQLPPLDAIVIHEVIIRRDGPIVLLRFDLEAFPERPPTKWLRSDFNTVQLRLSAIGVKELSVERCSTTMNVQMLVAEAAGGVSVMVDDGSISFAISASHLQIDSISAYRDESKAAL